MTMLLTLAVVWHSEHYVEACVPNTTLSAWRAQSNLTFPVTANLGTATVFPSPNKERKI